MMNFKMVIAYDGSRYQGWQKNSNASGTVQEKVEELLSKYFNEPIKVIASGRTDKGVHALGQVVNFRLKSVPKDLEACLEELNRYAPDDLQFSGLEQAAESFHARFSAKGKTYAYHLWTGYPNSKPLFNKRYVAVAEQDLDLEAMRTAARKFIGRHDFKGFSNDKTKKGTIRTITSIEIDENANEIVIRIKGDGFLYNMVRIIVGTLIEIGEHKRNSGSIDEVFKTMKRSDAGPTAPPEGLFQENVDY